jgi:hypothetical protein
VLHTMGGRRDDGIEASPGRGSNSVVKGEASGNKDEVEKVFRVVFKEYAWPDVC